MVQNAHFLGSSQILALPMHRQANWSLVGASGLVNRAMITGIVLEATVQSAVIFFHWIPEVSIWVIDNALQQSRY